MPLAPADLDPLSVALRVAEAIESCGGEYFIGGSLASALQGEPRATNDIDMVIKFPAGRIQELAARLGPDFEVDTEMLRDALLRRSSCNIFFLPTVLKIDLFALGDGPFDQIEFARRTKVQIRATGEQLVLKSPEDTVLRKLLWFRDGGEVSTKQWRDIVQVLRVNPNLDAAYLDSWAARLGIVDILAQARIEAAI